MTRGPDKQFDRQDALQKAMQVFWDQGYEPTGVADLLGRMGIGRQSMYDTFGSKRELFLESLRTYLGQQRQCIGAVLGAPGTTLQRLERLIEDRVRLAKQAGRSGCLVGNSVAELGPHDPEVAAIISSFFDEMKGTFADALRAGQAAGEVRGDLDADQMASVLIVTMQGAALFSKVETDLETSRNAFAGLLSVLRPL